MKSLTMESLEYLLVAMTANQSFLTLPTKLTCEGYVTLGLSLEVTVTGMTSLRNPDLNFLKEKFEN